MRANQYYRALSRGVAVSGFILPNEADLSRIYSLRKYHSYSGFCVRVVRTSDSTTLDVGFVGDVLDTAALIAFCTGTTGKIDRWYDQAGSGSFAFQSTDALRPVVYESGTLITEGGKPSFRWPQASSLSLGSILNIESAFFVYKITTIQGLNTLVRNGSSSQIWAGGTAIGGVNGMTIWTGTVRVSNTSENTNYNLSSYFGGSDDRVDTNASNSAVSGTAIATIPVSEIGRSDGNFSINGKYHEVILYGASQFSNKSIIENNINDYYSIY